MGFLSGLGDVFHAIGHFVSGGDSNAPTSGATFDQQQEKKQQQNQAPQQPQQPSPTPQDNNSPGNGNMINLTPLEKTPGNSINLNNNPSFAQPNTLQKTPPQPSDNTDSTNAQAPPKQGGGFFHDITHNPVTNVVGGVAKSLGGTAEYFGKNDIIDPARELADQATGNQAAYNQEMANNNVDLGLSKRNPDGSITGNNLAGGLEKWAGNSANALLTVAAPGVDNAIEKASGNIISDAAPTVVKTLAPKVASGAALGGAFNDAASVGNGDVNPADLVKSFGEGAAVGGLTGGLLGGAGMIKSGLSKAPISENAPTLDSQADIQPGEVGVGVKSVNPAQATDAQQQINQRAITAQPSAPQEVDNTPAYQRAPAKAASAAQAAQDQEAHAQTIVPDTQLDKVPAYQHQQNIQAVIDDGNQQLNNWANDNPNASPQEIEAAREGISQQVTGTIKKLQDQRMPSFGDVIKGEVTDPTAIAEGSTVAGTLAKEAADQADAAKQRAATPQPVQPESPPPTVEFNEGPSVTPGTLPPDTVNASPTAAIDKTPGATISAPTPAPITPTPSPDITDNTPAFMRRAQGETTVQTPQAAEVAQQPVQVAQPQLSATVDTAPQTQAATPEQQTAAAVQQQASATPAALITDEANNADALGRRRADNAPNIQAGLAKQLGDISKQLGDPGQHDVLSNTELTETANRLVQTVPDQSLVDMYKNGVQFDNNAASLAEANAALPRLAQLARAGNQDAVSALDNVVQAVADIPSKAGRSLNYAQEMFSNLPVEAKVPLMIRNIDKTIMKAGGSEEDLLRNNLPKQNEVATKMTNLLTNDETLRNQLAGVEGRAEQIGEAAKTGQLPEGAAQELPQLGRQADNLALQIQQNGGDAARYYNSLLPKNALTQRAADYARTSMLTAPSGRINNVFNVGGNSLYEIARSLPQAALNKVINAVKGGGTTESKSLFNRGLFRGLKEGLQKTGSELQGKALSSDIRSDLGRNKNTGNYELVKTTDNKGVNKLVNTTQALVKAPSNIVGGAIREAQVNRLARQEADSLGLRGSDAKVYAQARSIVSSKDMRQNAQQLQDVVSHMNSNPLANIFSKLGKASGESSGTAKGVAGLVKNTLLAFPKYPATFVWNTLTDRNVVADTVKAANAVRNGDLNGLTRAISGAGIDGTGMYVGYHLAKQGIITNKNSQGYNDDGAYLHIGNRYIPLGFMGVAGESLLGGAGIYSAINSKGGNPAGKFASTVADTVMNTLKMAGGQSLVGADNQGLQAVDKAVTGSDNVSPADAAAVLGGQAVGQFIPGAASDTNAVLNQTGLNPTHEAAQTKVTKGSLGVTDKNGAPSTAKAIPQSEVKTLINRIPVASQLALSRNPANASNDFIDRVTRGDHVGVPQQQQADQTQAQKSAVQKEFDANIPVYQPKTGTVPKGYNFNNTLNSDIQTGKFDKVQAGLQNELKSMTTPGPEHIPPDKIQEVKDRMSQFQLAQKNKWSYDDMKLYNSTSVTAWRDMGNPTKNGYDPATYQKLWAMDATLAKSGVAGTLGISDSSTVKASDKQKFALSSSSGGSGSNSAAKLIKSNTIGSVPQLAREDFTTNLKAQQISAKIPQIQLTKPDSLIKAHTISVSNPKP